MTQIIGIRWVLIPKFCELTGYTKDAINSKIDKGFWIEEIHWRKSPDNRRQINIEEYIKWVEGDMTWLEEAA
ncbi:hypothetical protein [Methylophaga thiooxydans]|uniref:hypothetical protein n=1 Tax=Methylophaga thiooxydans TaxID=392484 RepID=UPI0023524DA2|nr:hypothetical protein [Methylophaga thiooxydans]